MRGRRILEINPDHPIVKDLNAACKNNPSSTEAKRAVDLLYDTALISNGYTPDSPAELGNKIYEIMAIAFGGRWGRTDTQRRQQELIRRQQALKLSLRQQWQRWLSHPK